MRARDRRDQRQPEAAAGARAAGLEPHETLEDVLAVGFGNAGAVVGDGETDRALGAFRDRDFDPGSASGVFDGVVEEIGERLRDEGAAAADGRRGLGLQGKREAGVLRRRLIKFGHLLGDGDEIDRLAENLNAMLERIEALMAGLKEVSDNIAHDLKTPLTRAQLRVEYLDNAELRNQINGDLAEMLAMVESTLAFLKGDQTGEPVQDFDLKAILESICDDLTDAGHHVTFSATRNIVLRGRHHALKRAFNNLIANAAKYAATVTVTTACRDGAVEVLVDDDGPGIPIDQREAVFQPFYRIEASRNRATGGTGLGLTVARTIIRGHGGDVTLHDAPSGGLRARVSLPLPLPPRGAGTRKQKDIEAKSP